MHGASTADPTLGPSTHQSHASARPCLRPGPLSPAASTITKVPAAMGTIHPLGARGSPYSPVQAPGITAAPCPQKHCLPSLADGAPRHLASDPSQGPLQAPLKPVTAGSVLCSCPRGCLPALPVHGTPPALGCRQAVPPMQCPQGEAETPPLCPDPWQEAHLLGLETLESHWSKQSGSLF